ncbi:conserved unknown protein [Ectocarpus siliculosus]|uniref:Molybdate-anion transporter n=1 Tax=Ectocarpus siliculosus TaxID=2880 RepID=D8LBU0_ECTSI|nr:conserved unknown protein [Ectocarpus siliculosus]|eukprot:CBN76799.1 conserved unknown protein [Ectocarpus siliculosus]
MSEFLEVEPSTSTGYALSLLMLGLGLGVLTVRMEHQQRMEQLVEVTKDFKTFQASFMGVYLTALLTEWFQSAFLFVYLREMHPEQFVVRMYLAGAASQLSLSVLLEVMGGFVPHKLRCAACLALQAGSAVLMLHPAFGGLVTSRVLGGFAAALLHSSFEAWMVEQHVGQGFPLDWFTHTFNKLSVAMSVLAVATGPAVTAAHDLAGGSVGPFKLSLVLTAVNGCLLLSWRRDSNKPPPACGDIVRLVSRAWAAMAGGNGGGGGRNIALVTAAQACFEAATFAFALLWTPLLRTAGGGDDGYPGPELPWGMVFSQQLACVMIGSVVFKLAMSLSPGTTAEKMCFWASAGGALCFFALSLGLPRRGVQTALLGYELCVGLYLNAMGMMRSKHIPQEVRGLVLAGSKLVTTTALFVLLVFLSENRSIATGMCGALLTAAAVCSARSAREHGDGGGDDGAFADDGQALSGGKGGGQKRKQQQGDHEEEGAELIGRR